MEKVDSHQGGFVQSIEAMCRNYSKPCLSFLCITNSRVFFRPLIVLPMFVILLETIYTSENWNVLSKTMWWKISQIEKMLPVALVMWKHKSKTTCCVQYTRKLNLKIMKITVILIKAKGTPLEFLLGTLLDRAT